MSNKANNAVRSVSILPVSQPSVEELGGKFNGFCYIYTRVSTTKQVNDGCSLENQLNRCREEASLRGLKVLRVFSDEGISGRNFSRKGLNQLKSVVSKNEYVITLSFSRIGRKMVEVIQLYEEMLEKGVKILCVCEPYINDDSPTGKFLRNMLANMYEWEVNETDKRSASVIEGKRICGEQTAPIGFGYDCNEINGRRYVYPVLHEQEGISFAIECRNKEPPVSWSILGRTMIEKEWFPKKSSEWKQASLDKLIKGQKKYREKIGYYNFTMGELRMYDKYRVPFIVPPEHIMRNIDSKTNTFDYFLYFGHRYRNSETKYTPDLDTIYDDIKSGKIETTDKVKNDVYNAHDNGIDEDGNPLEHKKEDDFFDFSTVNPEKLIKFMSMVSHVEKQEDINKMARIYFKTGK